MNQIQELDLNEIEQVDGGLFPVYGLFLAGMAVGIGVTLLSVYLVDRYGDRVDRFLKKHGF